MEEEFFSITKIVSKLASNWVPVMNVLSFFKFVVVFIYLLIYILFCSVLFFVISEYFFSFKPLLVL